MAASTSTRRGAARHNHQIFRHDPSPWFPIAVSAAYQQFRQSGTTGLDRAEIFEDYRLLPDIAGLQELYDIEDRTTEKTS